jgi:hypothetical protein
MSVSARRSIALVAVALATIAPAGNIVAQSPGTAGPSGSPTASPPWLPYDGAPVASGRYVSNVGDGASVTLDLADDAWFGQGGRMAVLDRDIDGDTGELMVTTFDAVLTDPCSRDIEARGAVPKDARAFADWLLGQPWAVATEAEATLGGQPAIGIDISALDSPCPDTSMFVWLYLDGGPYRLYPTEALRVIAQDRGSDLVLVTAETLHAESLPAFLEAAQPVIDSLAFGEPLALPDVAPSPGEAPAA